MPVFLEEEMIVVGACLVGLAAGLGLWRVPLLMTSIFVVWLVGDRAGYVETVVLWGTIGFILGTVERRYISVLGYSAFVFTGSFASLGVSLGGFAYALIINLVALAIGAEMNADLAMAFQNHFLPLVFFYLILTSYFSGSGYSKEILNAIRRRLLYLGTFWGIANLVMGHGRTSLLIQATWWVSPEVPPHFAQFATYTLGLLLAFPFFAFGISGRSEPLSEVAGLLVAMARDKKYVKFNMPEITNSSLSDLKIVTPTGWLEVTRDVSRTQNIRTVSPITDMPADLFVGVFPFSPETVRQQHPDRDHPIFHPEQWANNLAHCTEKNLLSNNVEITEGNLYPYADVPSYECYYEHRLLNVILRKGYEITFIVDSLEYVFKWEATSAGDFEHYLDDVKVSAKLTMENAKR